MNITPTKIISMKSNVRLLIVDDDVEDRNFVIAAVKEIDADIECITANDGQQALEVLLNSPTLPDLVLLDLRMPRFGGRKCLVEMRKNTRFENLPVIIYTTSTEVEESQELKKMGALHFISKPTNPDEIYYLMSMVLEDQVPLLQKKSRV